MLNALDNEAASFGLKISTRKTKSMTIVNSSTTSQPGPNIIVLNVHPVEEVSQLTHLGSEICKNGGSDADVDCRLRKAKEAFGIVHAQTALNNAYLKAMSYQFCCMSQSLGKSPNQLSHFETTGPVKSSVASWHC